MSSTRTLVYVYGIAEAPVAGRLSGIDGGSVRWIAATNLAAAVSDVPVAEFDEAPLNANVQDMGWLGPRAVAHDAVNGLLWERADAVVPLAFGTVFRDDSGVRTLLEANQTSLCARLERVRGRGEWVVAVYRRAPLDQAQLGVQSDAVQALRAEIAAASAGRAHLLRRRVAELEATERKRLDADAADAFLAEAASLADGLFVEPIPMQAVERPLVRATLLVPHGVGERTLPQLAERWQNQGFEVSVTGPTPPYRFTALDRDD
jgi:hypothetical protein